MVKNLHYRNFILVLGILLIYTCQKSDILDISEGDGDRSINQESKDIVIDQITFDTLNSDDFNITAASIENDSLILKIAYGGGCGVVKYFLITDGLFMESHPVQLKVSLSFNDFDTCEALINQKFSTNLRNLADYYRQLYRTEHDSIIIHLEGYAESLIYSF